MSLPTLTSLLSFYTHLTSHIVPGPNNLSYFIPFFLLPSALCIPPSILSHRQLYLLFLPVIYALQIHSWMQMHGVDVISVNLTLWSFLLLVIFDPRRKFRRIHVRDDGEVLEEHSDKRSDNLETALAEATKEDSSTEGEPLTDSPNGSDASVEGLSASPRRPLTSSSWEESYPTDLQKRVIWVLTLLPSWRFPSWHISRPFHDIHQPPPRSTRPAFLRFALLSILEGYLLLDLTSLYTPYDPYFHVSNTAISSPFPTPPASNTAIPRYITTLWAYASPRLLRAAVLALQLYALIPHLFALPALMPLFLNYAGLASDTWSPHTWPPFFGPFSSITYRGLRALWGTWWHQMNRYLHSSPGAWAADHLHLKRGGWMRYAFIVISGFGFSGIMHTGLIPPFPLYEALSATQMRAYVASFFWVQVPGIFIELVVAEAVGRWAPRWKEGVIARSVTLAWVALWLCWTLPLLVVPFRELGYWTYPPMPISILGWMTGRGWWTWG